MNDAFVEGFRKEADISSWAKKITGHAPKMVVTHSDLAPKIIPKVPHVPIPKTTPRVTPKPSSPYRSMTNVEIERARARNKLRRAARDVPPAV